MAQLHPLSVLWFLKIQKALYVPGESGGTGGKNKVVERRKGTRLSINWATGAEVDKNESVKKVLFMDQTDQISFKSRRVLLSYSPNIYWLLHACYIQPEGELESKTPSLISEQVQHFTCPPLGFSHHKEPAPHRLLPLLVSPGCCPELPWLFLLLHRFFASDPGLGPILVFYHFLKLDD